MRSGSSSSRFSASINPGYGLAYYRVSTSDQANTSFDEDGFSIQAQREYCQRKAADMGVELVVEYVDRGKSARTADRPELQAMLARIKEDTDIQYVFVHKLDRLARSRADDVQISLFLANHGVKLVSCTENFDDTPTGKLAHNIMADFNEYYSANLGEEAKKGLRKKVEAGGSPGNVPLGYRNARLKIVELGKDIGIVKTHKVYGPIMTECFKLYDSGRCTVEDVADYANEQGLRLPANKRLPERPITAHHMQRLLRNRYYTGWVRFGGVDYKGEHPRLIDESTFERVQALLTARNTNKDKSRKRPHHLKGCLFCAHCGRRLGITVATKTRTGSPYAYFYCLGRQRDKESCSQGYIPLSEIEHAVRSYWANVRLSAARSQSLRRVILSEFAGKHEQGQSEIEKQKRRIVELEQRRRKAKAAYYADVLELREFKAEQEAIKRGVKAAQDIIATWSVELESITQSLDDALRLLEDPQGLYESFPEGLKLLLVQTVFEKIWILDTSVVGCDLTAPFAELLTLEAKLTIDEKGSEATYYRRRETILSLSHLGNSWERPSIERPHGALAIDEKDSGPSAGRSSNIEPMAGVRGFKLNPDLRSYLNGHPYFALAHYAARLLFGGHLVYDVRRDSLTATA
jgi:site-specific DNA recombinase